MKIGIDIRPLMDARPSGVSEYAFRLIKEILKLDTENEYRLFYNCFGDCSNIPEFQAKNVKIIKYNYPNKILNYLFFKFFNYPKIDKELAVDLFFMPHLNFIGLAKNSASPSFPPPARQGRSGGERPFGRAGIKGGFNPPNLPLQGGQRGVKSLITVHDLSFLRYPEFFSARKNFWHKALNAKKLLKRFELIVAVSENTKRDIVELCGISPDKVKVIYSGVGEEYRKILDFRFSILDLNINSNYQNLNFDEKRLVEVKSKYNLPDKFILYLGTIEPRKNVEGVIRAYNELRVMSYELRDYKLVIAGGRGWKSKNVYPEKEKSQFKGDIKFLDYVDGQDKVYLYNLASVFVYPSFYEGFGLPPLEAMASGSPVVASFASSLPEVVGDAALTVDPYNINDIARALTEVLTDNNLRNKLIARGLEQAKKFSWEKTAREYLKIFNNQSLK